MFQEDSSIWNHKETKRKLLEIERKLQNFSSYLSLNTSEHQILKIIIFTRWDTMSC